MYTELILGFMLLGCLVMYIGTILSYHKTRTRIETGLKLSARKVEEFGTLVTGKYVSKLTSANAYHVYNKLKFFTDPIRWWEVKWNPQNKWVENYNEPFNYEKFCECNKIPLVGEETGCSVTLRDDGKVISRSGFVGGI